MNMDHMFDGLQDTCDKISKETGQTNEQAFSTVFISMGQALHDANPEQFDNCVKMIKSGAMAMISKVLNDAD